MIKEPEPIYIVRSQKRKAFVSVSCTLFFSGVRVLSGALAESLAVPKVPPS
jgi:hypothetical protein